MIIVDCEQRTEEWFKVKAGVISAGSMDKVVTSKGLPSKSCDKYLMQLAGERIVGYREDGYSNATMQRGTELEGEARDYFKLVQGKDIQEVGFIFKDEQRTVGCSPDGLIGEDEGIEIKCPILSTQVEYLLAQKLPTKYVQQVQGSMYVTGRKVWWFISYYPGLDPLLLKIERDEGFIEKLHKEVETATLELAMMIRKLKGV